MEDAVGGLIRLPLFKVNGHSNHLARKDGFDKMVESFRSRPFNLRPVKQNALKASFLFQKPQDLQSKVLRARHRCRTSINEIIRGVSDSLGKSIPVSSDHLNLRRSSEERKKDWRMAMSRVGGAAVVDNISGLHRISSPVLPSILLASDVNQRLDISAVPVQPVSLSHQPITIASVWTNMVFDLEMLLSLLEESQREYRLEFKHSYNVKNAINSAYPQSDSWTSLRMIFHLLNSSKSWCLLPVTKRTPFRITLGRPPTRNISRIFEIDFTEQNLRKAYSKISVLKDTYSCDKNNEEEVVFCFLRSVQKPFTPMDDLTVLKMKRQSSLSNSLGVIPPPQFEHDEDFAMNGKSERVEFSLIVILPGTMLQTKDVSVPNSLRTGLEPKSMPITENDSYFSDLHRFLRQSSKVREVPGLWSAGSREVMKKYHHERTILSRGFEKRDALLQMIEARDILLVSKHMSMGSVGEVIGFEKAADTLLRAFSKTSRLLLPLSVDLMEDIRFSLLQEANHRMESCLSPEKLLDQHYDYDVILKNQSGTLVEYIPKSGIKRTNNPSSSPFVRLEYTNTEDERNEENTSQESALNDILTSDDDQEPEPEKDPAMAVPQKEPILQHMKCNGNREEKAITKPIKPIMKGTKSSEQETRKVRLRVPENLMCSPWSLKLAEHCVANMPRGTLLLPPCLSALPSLCVIINTHLSNRLQDHRVAIICESESDISIGLSSYIEHSFACKMSVEVIKRWNFPCEPKYPALNRCTAQILILDSFDFSLPSGVSLLLVLVCEPRLTRSRPQLGFRPRPKSINPRWPHLASILIAPIDCWVPLPAYIDAAEKLSAELKTHAVMFVADYDDVHISVLLAKPRALFLVPLKEASELISVIDSHSTTALVKLRHFLSGARSGLGNLGPHTFPDFSVSFLRSVLEDQQIERNSETYHNLETVYYLRQARSYALYDGFDVAMAFLLHCRDELQPSTSRLLQEMMRRVDTIETQTTNAHGDHPVVSPVAAHMKRMQDDFAKEPPSMSLTHRRTAFLPLIIADSREAVDGFRRGQTKAKLLLEAGEQDIAICWSSDLVAISFRNQTFQEKIVLDKLKEFTHIYHIIDGRENTHSESKFPPCILQLVHAGRTRLVTVIVDERRAFESLWTSSHKMYDTMRKYIGDQSRFSGTGGIQVLREMNWEAVTHMLRSLW